MIRQKMTMRLAILFLLLGTAMAWSQRTHRPRPAHVADDPTVAESKINSRFSHQPKSSSSYVLDEGHHYPKGGSENEEYVESEDLSSEKEQDEAQGKEESDHSVKNDEYNDHSEKGDHKEFQAGGASFDKHLKDHKADNKEVENVKQHDVGEKFGGQSTKEHKLGKHKEKSKGHKLHGFKNVYHKEEYGDHKTFHDEFLDTDHHHNYDDHHEHEELQGGKFSKGFKHEGKNKKYDKGDEKHEWGKEEFDGHNEGKHEKGKQTSKHRHGSKKHQGQFDANSHRNKNSVHKVQKGVPPPPPYVPHGGHHGPHQAQIETYVPHHNSHHVPTHNYNPPIHHQSHHAQHDDDKHSSNGDHGSHYHDGHHHSSHGSHHHAHSGHHGDDHFSQDNDHDTDYHERRAHNHKHKSSSKEDFEDNSDEKFLPTVKHHPVARKHESFIHRTEPVAHKHESLVHRHEPVAHKHEAFVHRKEPVAHRHEPFIQKHESFTQKHEPFVQKHESFTQKHEPFIQKHEPFTQKHEPVARKLEPVAFKQSVSPNYGIHQYRQPVFQENPKLSEPIKQEKLSHPFNERSQHSNHGVRYGFQPRDHQHHHNNYRFHHNHQQQPFPRFQGFGRHHQSHGHHHHGDHKTHSHFRNTPSSYQQELKQDLPIPKVEQSSSTKPFRNEDHHRFSQKLPE